MPRCNVLAHIIANIPETLRARTFGNRSFRRERHNETKAGTDSVIGASILFLRLFTFSWLLIFTGPATAATPVWSGPTTGPSAAVDKQIVLVAADMRNDGIFGAVGGVREAAAVLGWRVTVLDGNGNDRRTADAMHHAVEAPVDGVVLFGTDAVSWMPEYADAAVAHRIPIVGWHVGPKPGSIDGTPVAANITTEGNSVADLAVQAAIDQYGGSASVAILTDHSLAIALSKSRRMASLIRGCERCTLLEMIDVPIDDTSTMMPGAVRDLVRRYGRRLTHIMAINDLYFDDAVETLREIGVEPQSLSLVSAGDGSPKAFDRIRQGMYQTATVAEPLNLQGWLLLDELNRLFAHKPISGFVPPPHLFVRENINSEGGDRNCYDPDNGYRTIYRHIWQR